MAISATERPAMSKSEKLETCAMSCQKIVSAPAVAGFETYMDAAEGVGRKNALIDKESRVLL
jgi:hypothetical protein